MDQADLMPEHQEDATDDHPAEENDSSLMFSFCALVSFRRQLAVTALETETIQNVYAAGLNEECDVARKNQTNSRVVPEMPKTR